MRIIKSGDTTLLNQPRLFVCPHCRCEFEANSIEYCLTDQLAQIYDNIIAECICPCCGQMAYSYGN